MVFEPLPHLRLTEAMLSDIGQYVDRPGSDNAYLDLETGRVIPSELLDEALEVELMHHRLSSIVGDGPQTGLGAMPDMLDFVEGLADRELAQKLAQALRGSDPVRGFGHVMAGEADTLTFRTWDVCLHAGQQLRALDWLNGQGVIDPREMGATSDVIRRRRHEAYAAIAAPRARARLILLNGLPGAGKSTLAARWRDRHPGVLLVDADQLRHSIGGDPADHAEASRHLALAMASAHLETGHDVVMPQLVAYVDQVWRFMDAAALAGAELVMVVLDAGGRVALAEPHRHYEEALRRVVVDAEAVVDTSGGEDASYARLAELLDGAVTRRRS